MSKPKDLILPPQEIRAVIDKTAEFVAKMGPEFEKKILSQQGGEKKFAFLATSSPYRRYYDTRVRDLKEGRTTEVQGMPKVLEDMKRQEASLEPDHKAPTVKTFLKLTMPGMPTSNDVDMPLPPPVDTYTVPEPIESPQLIEIIKTTARFAARNGKRFLEGLTHREGASSEFRFLIKTDELYPYFSALVSAYTASIIVPSEEREKALNATPTECFKRCLTRFEYEARTQAIFESQQQSAKGVDWKDFVVVEELSIKNGPFADAVRIPELSARKVVVMSEEEEEQEQEEEQEEEHEEEEEELDMTMLNEPLSANNSSTTNIVPSFRRKRPIDQTFVTCPITGQQVLASNLSEHLRVVLIDPQWKKRKEEVVGKAKIDTVDVAGNLADFVLKRGDAFTKNRLTIGPKLPQ